MKNKILTLNMLLATILAFAQATRIGPNTCIKVETNTTLDIGSGNLVIESDEMGDASLIDLGTVSFSGGGEAIVQRYLTEGNWHLISSPVGNAFAEMFLDDFLQYHLESSNLYTDITSLSYQLRVMQGYCLCSVEVGPTTELFVGTCNTGDLDKAFTQSGEGWNLVGNPYPSVLDWDAVTIPGELSAAIWLFDPTEGDNGDFKYYINGGGGANTTTQYIPSGQGFFVRAVGGAGTLSLDNSDRVHGGQAFYKNTETSEMLVLETTGNNITTQTAIRFNENATAEIDSLFDVYKIISNSTDVPNLYTRCETQNMAINTLPSIINHETVPAWFEAGQNGSYTILATELNTIPEEIPVYLEDVELNYFQDLRAKPEYEFNYSSGEPQHFKVHFKEVTGLESYEDAMNPAVQCYLSNDILHVNFLETEALSNINASISVFSITGQLMLNTRTAQQKNEIPFHWSQSSYIIRVTTNDGVYSTKISNN